MVLLWNTTSMRLHQKWVKTLSLWFFEGFKVVKSTDCDLMTFHLWPECLFHPAPGDEVCLRAAWRQSASTNRQRQFVVSQHFQTGKWRDPFWLAGGNGGLNRSVSPAQDGTCPEGGSQLGFNWTCLLFHLTKLPLCWSAPSSSARGADCL